MIQYFREFKYVYGEYGIIGLCFLAKTFMPDPGKYWNNPILYIKGKKATGKTELSKSILKLVERDCKTLSFYSVRRENLREELHGGSFVYVHIDDINKPLCVTHIELIKSAFDKFYNKFLVISGTQDLYDNVALYSRTIHLDLDSLPIYEYNNQSAKEAFRAFLFIRNNALIREHTFRYDERNFVKSVVKAEIAKEKFFPMAEERLKDNYASLLSAYYYFSDIMTFTEQEAISAIINSLEAQEKMLQTYKISQQ